MKFRYGLVAALLSTASGVALSQSWWEEMRTPAVQTETQRPSFYIGIHGGFNFPITSDLTGPGVPAGTRARWDTGWLAGGTFGYSTGYGFHERDNFRVELEGTYRRNGLDNIRGISGRGRLANISAMGNVIYDIYNFPLAGLNLTPYVGIGIGVSYVQVRTPAVPGVTRIADHDVSFAYQGIAGLGVQITENWGLGIDYRFFGTLEPRVTTGSPPRDSNLINRHHSVVASLRYHFGAVRYPPEPAPLPAPAPAPPPPPPPQVTERPAQQAFIVFFDFNRSNLRPDAQETVRQAAAVIMAGGSARMTLVTGHTDTVGSPRYNMALSQRRADTVRSALVQLGVPANVITTRAAGESQLLVPTPDNTREAQNRRAEIVVQ